MIDSMEGILLVDKPKGWTSFDVVNFVRKIVAQSEGKRPKSVKVGHTGTLDPMATGLLVLLVGKNYTRQAQALTKLDKTYEVEMSLGHNSTTGDTEGELEEISNQIPPVEKIKEVITKFTGDIMQTPPAFSAIKINGKRAYDMARAGQEVVIEPRQVTISRSQLISYEYPKANFVCDVSSGTYIRSLAQDIGQELGTGAYLTGLRRSRVGKYNLTDAIQISRDTPDLESIIANNLTKLELDS